MDLIADRKQWEEESLKTPVPTGVNIVEENIAGVHCHRVSSGRAATDSVVLYLHGGGLISGSVITHRGVAASITEALDMPVLLVDYRLLPESAFPAPLNDALAVYHSLITIHQYTSDKIVLAGDSSGAGLVLSLLVELVAAGDRLPSKAFMLSGAFDMTLSGETMLTNDGQDPLLTLSELTRWRDQYLDTPDSPVLSSLFADLRHLPEILLLAGGKDLWLSDSQRVRDKIVQHGGKAELQVWKTMGHVWMMDPARDETTQAMDAISRFLRP